MEETKLIILSAIGGILPAFLWLWFWLREDKLHPEPRRLIMLSFVIGMLVVPAVLPVEKFFKDSVLPAGIAVIIVLSFIEEIGKFFGAWFSALRRKECDEPIDPMIYMITTALGFAALENALFLFGHNTGGIFSLLVTGNLRFVGASLLHVLASGAMGFFIALSAGKSAPAKLAYGIAGLSIATALHAFFNLFIILIKGNGLIIAFLYVWVSIIILLAAFEKIKRLKGPTQTSF